MIKMHKISVIFLSGDIHEGEIMQMPCSLEQFGYVIYEITSSGMSFTNMELTHIYPNFEEIVNYAIPPGYNSQRYLYRNYGMITVNLDRMNLSNSDVILGIYGNYTLSPVLYK